MTLGELIKEYRSKYNLSMDAFSDKSGISKAYISLLEKNKHPKTGKPISPSIQCIKQAADAMNIDFNILFSKIDADKSSADTTMPTESFDHEWRYPPVSNRLGTILKNFRKQTGVSVQAFSQKLGIDENTYTNIESGKYSQNYKLPPEFIRQLSTVTGYEVDYILGATDHTSVPTNETISINNAEYPVRRSEANFHFKTRLEELCQENDINLENVEERIGITKQSFIDIQWNRMPSLPELLRIAYSLGVSMDYLIGKTDIRMSSLDSDELELILDYRDCPPVYKENIRKRAHDLSIDAMLKDEEPSVAADDELKKTGTDSLGK